VHPLVCHALPLLFLLDLLLLLLLDLLLLDLLLLDLLLLLLARLGLGEGCDVTLDLTEIID
jgi:hypothetical protein